MPADPCQLSYSPCLLLRSFVFGRRVTSRVQVVFAYSNQKIVGQCLANDNQLLFTCINTVMSFCEFCLQNTGKVLIMNVRWRSHEHKLFLSIHLKHVLPWWGESCNNRSHFYITHDCSFLHCCWFFAFNRFLRCSIENKRMLYWKCGRVTTGYWKQWMLFIRLRHQKQWSFLVEYGIGNTVIIWKLSWQKWHWEWKLFHWIVFCWKQWILYG